MAPVPDVPPAICQPVDLSGSPLDELQSRRAAGWARRDEIVHFRLGNDLLSFPAAFLLLAADPASFGCVNAVQQISFAFWASDMAPADREMFREPLLEAAAIAPTHQPNDFIIKVNAFYGNKHPDWPDLGKRLTNLRQSEKPLGMLYGLQDFSRLNVQYLVLISEDRGVLVRSLNDPAPPYPIAEISFQNEHWFARTLVPIRTVPRWDFIYNRIDAFVAQHLVKGYFKR